MIFKKIGVFCGSSRGNSALYAESAEQLADVMSSKKMTLVYGGAKVGLMNCIAERMLKNGSPVIGVIPQSLAEVEIAHEGLTELHMVNSMHERKVLITELSDGFVMLPGGPGSLDEFFEVFTLGQLGYHLKPFGILNVNGYYDHLLRFLDHAVTQGFLKQIHRNMIIIDESADLLVNKLMNYQATVDKKWIINSAPLTSPT